MINLSEIFAKNNFADYLCLLNKNTESFKDFFPNYILVDNFINEELLWDSIKNGSFMNLKIFFSNLSSFYQKEYNNKILKILEEIPNNETYKSLTIISPLGVFPTLNFINDMTNQEVFKKYPVTKILSGNFLKFHKFHCSLKNKNSILLTFFFHYSYNLGDFFNFFIRNNFCQNIENFSYNSLIIKSFLQGLELLTKNNNYKEDFFTSKFHGDLMDFSLIKTNNVYDTYIYWKNYFKEAPMDYCFCNYISVKEIDNFTYYRLESQVAINKNNISPIKRHVNIELHIPENINNYRKFYLENILKFPENKKLLENYYQLNNQKIMKNIKVKSLVFNKKTSVFSWYY